MLKIKRDKNSEYNNNKLDDLMIRGREKIRSSIFKSFVVSSRTDGRREGFL